MCQCATPGPWVWDHNGFVYPTVDVSKMGFPRDWPPSLYKNDKVGKGPAICRVHHIELFETRKHDVNFITEAREALPYWLQRVRELEEENARLWAVAEAARKVNNVLNSWPNMTKYHPAACDLNKALAALEGGNEHE